MASVFPDKTCVMKVVVMARSRLQTEIKKQQPFEVPEQAAALNLLRTHDLLMNRFTRLFREYGLTPSQYNVLRILRGEGKPLPSQEIASRMIQVVPAMTGLVDRLEQHGYVGRRRCQDDRRVIFIELTPAGSALLQQLDEPVLELHRELLGHLTRSDLGELSRLLEKARERLTF